jgi:hypothetical protein
MGTNDLTIITQFFTRNAIFRLTIAMEAMAHAHLPWPPEMLLEDFCPEAAIDEVHHPQDVTCQRDPSGEDHMLRVDALLKAVGDSMPQNRTLMGRFCAAFCQRGKLSDKYRYIYMYKI